MDEGRSLGSDSGTAAGVVAALSVACFFCAFSLSVINFFKKALIVMRRVLLGRQSSPLTGSCRQMGQAWGSEDWPCNDQSKKPSINGYARF